MPLALHWFLPTAGDSRDVAGFGPTVSRRQPTLRYLTQVAGAAEQLGFDAVLTPTGTWCEDAWLSTAALIGATERLRFLVAFRPGFLSPTLAAQQAATFQRLSGGRLLLNVVTGGDPAEQRSFGDHLDHDQRYERTAEFLQIVRGAWSGRPSTSTASTTASRARRCSPRPSRRRRSSSVGPRRPARRWRLPTPTPG